jgi:hypothetical protein
LGAVDVLITKKKTNFHNVLATYLFQHGIRYCATRAKTRKTTSRHVTSLNTLHVLKPLAGLEGKTRKRRLAVTSPSGFNLNNNITNVALYTNRNYLLHVLKEININHYTIIVPTTCTSLLKAQDITICTFLSLYS